MPFLQDLARIGNVFLFGSTIEQDHPHPSDLDIALIVPDGESVSARELVTLCLRHHGIEKDASVQPLLRYERSRTSEFLPKYHVLIAERSDLKQDHAIIPKVLRGLQVV